MEALLKQWKTLRSKYIEILDKYSLEQLNMVPDQFSNSIAWNIGHIIEAQQGLIYKSSDTPWHISMELYDLYKSGTKPERDLTQSEIDLLRELLSTQLLQTETDIKNNVFSAYNERKTGTGFHLSTLEDALHFNNIHEGIHLGIIMGMRRFVE